MSAVPHETLRVSDCPGKMIPLGWRGGGGGGGGQRLAALSFHRRVDVKLPGIYSTCPVKETFNKHSVRVESVAFSPELGTGDGLVSANRVNILSVNVGWGGGGDNNPQSFYLVPSCSLFHCEAAGNFAVADTLLTCVISLPRLRLSPPVSSMEFTRRRSRISSVEESSFIFFSFF